MAVSSCAPRAPSHFVCTFTTPYLAFAATATPLERTMALGKKSGKKTQETSKKRKVPNDAIETTAKRTRTTENQASASVSKEPSATPAPVRSLHATVTSEEEDAAVHGEDAITHVSDGNESEAESSEMELGELYIASHS
jgi:hypothetical protein